MPTKSAQSQSCQGQNPQRRAAKKNAATTRICERILIMPSSPGTCVEPGSASIRPEGEGAGSSCMLQQSCSFPNLCTPCRPMLRTRPALRTRGCKGMRDSRVFRWHMTPENKSSMTQFLSRKEIRLCLQALLERGRILCGPRKARAKMGLERGSLAYKRRGLRPRCFRMWPHDCKHCKHGLICYNCNYESEQKQLQLQQLRDSYDQHKAARTA